MSNFPDFSELGYQVERELGHNPGGGRVTYLANRSNAQLPVVIKQFQFAKVGTSWSDYEAYEKEIQLLQNLNHPGIPRYLDSFETPDGFCLVQGYKQACSLAASSHFTPQEIKQIALAVLEILVYLQSQTPPIIHRDIKPENILIGRRVYLVDFGFARTGGGEVSVSSVVKGTLGFMPPEQLFNRQLTKASDLYSLGATLICLLTQTKSSQIGGLIDETYRINFKHLVPHLSPQFIGWLEKMVAPSLKERFSDAATALEALRLIDVVGNATTLGMLFRTPKIKVGATVVAGLATLSFASWVSTASLINQSGNPRKIANTTDAVKQLLETGQCRECDLRGADLANVNLMNADLENADLMLADLTGANLKRANLGGANLTNAEIASVNLTDADLGGANLANANLRGSNLTGANLTGAKLGGARLGSANLADASLTNADLGGANLTNANLGDAKLWGVTLWGANLASANLKGAELGGARLEGANLEGANLEGANLEDAKLERVNLEGANLRRATMPDGSNQQ